MYPCVSDEPFARSLLLCPCPLHEVPDEHLTNVQAMNPVLMRTPLRKKSQGSMRSWKSPEHCYAHAGTKRGKASLASSLSSIALW